MRYTRIPADTFKNIQLNAGVLCTTFNTSTGEFSGQIAATNGGITFNATPSFKDYGEDIDNCPKNMMELKKLESWEVKMSGGFITLSAPMMKKIISVADVSGDKITPRNDVKTSDFETLWWVGDYSDKNGENKGGFIAIKMYNTLNTGGFKLTSSDKSKGKMDFEFTAHYSMNAQTQVPFEVYVKAGEPESTDYQMTVTSVAGTTTAHTKVTMSKTATSTQSYYYQTGYNLILPSENQRIGGSSWTGWDGATELSSVTGMDIVVVITDSENAKTVHAGMTTVITKE